MVRVVDELYRLCERGILRIDGPCFRFRYQLVRGVLLANLSPARQRMLSQRLRAPDESDERRSALSIGAAPLNERGRPAQVFEDVPAAGQTASWSSSPVAAGPVVPLTERELEVLHLDD
jgi:hypothetical protein